MSRFVCSKCSQEFELDKPIWHCSCGGLLDLEFDARFPLTRIVNRKPTLWRYWEALPITDQKSIVSFDEGFTPLLDFDIDDHQLKIKQDYLFPTGSFKDRGATVLISKIKELGVDTVVEDSSGNAGCALAAYAAKAGIKCQIFIPDTTPEGKTIPIELFGAKMVKVAGDRVMTAEKALKAAEKNYYASHVWNPFFLHGTKTFAYEVCEQLGWQAPDVIVLPVGGGTLLLGTYIGFIDMLKADVIDRMPKLIGVQAENCAPIARAFANNADQIAPGEKCNTLAHGIAIAAPLRAKQVLKAVRETNGEFVTISEQEIVNALVLLGKQGIAAEPTGAAALAGARKYLRTLKSRELVVTVVSGSGFKASLDTAAVLQQKKGRLLH